MLERMLQNLISKFHTCPVIAPKPEPIILTMEALISDYNKEDLASALTKLEHDLGWKVFRAALIKEYLNKSLETMEHSGKTGKQIEAAFTSGCACTLYDVATVVIERYKDLLEGNSKVVEITRPSEE
jgi:hypothetical protein